LIPESRKAILGLLDPEREDNTLPQNVGDYFPLYTASHPRRRVSLLTNEAIDQKLRVIVSRRSTYQRKVFAFYSI
jgi:hypothetical protein